VTTQRRIPSLIAALFLLAACSSSVRIDQAEEVLRTYLADLHGGYYEGAALLFGGTFDQLEANNPDIDPTDRAGLLQRWCEQDGGVCLPIQIVVSRKAAGGGPSLSWSSWPTTTERLSRSARAAARRTPASARGTSRSRCSPPPDCSRFSKCLRTSPRGRVENPPSTSPPAPSAPPRHLHEGGSRRRGDEVQGGGGLGESSFQM